MTSRPGPTRRQFQSCDACRQRRKACDAGYLGIVPVTTASSNAASTSPTSLSDSQSTNPTSCTACSKKGTKCTFTWLLKHEKRNSLRDAPSSDVNHRINASSQLIGDRESVEAHRSDGLPAISGRPLSDSTRLYPDSTQGLIYTSSGTATEPSNLAWSSEFVASEPFAASRSTSGSRENEFFSAQPGQSLIQRQQSGRGHDYDDLLGHPITAANYHRPSVTTLIADHRLQKQQEGFAVADSFVYIYRRYLEHAFAGWSSVENSPYVASKKTLSTINLSANSDSVPITYYDRVIQLDSLADRLEIPDTPRLSPQQHSQAIEALHKVILAYASQWSIINNSQPQLSRNPTDSLAANLHSIMQKSLWHEARLAVAMTRHINTFKTILAQLIFSTIPQPLVDEGTMDPRVASTNARSCFDGALRDLIIWRQHLLAAWQLQTTWTPQQQSLHQSFWNDFGVIYWLAVMCDITYSAVTGFPLVISQKDSATTYWDDEKSRPGTAKNGPSPANMHSKRSKESTGPSLYDTLVIRTKPLDSPIAVWPLSEQQAANILKEAVTLKVFLYERVANLKALTRLAASSEQRERAIQDALLVYQRWEAIYGPFMSNCTDDWKSLVPRLAAWHVVLVGHWHFGALLLGDEIASVDASGHGDPARTLIRTKSLLVGELVISNARALANLAQRSIERGPDPYSQQIYSTSLEPWSAMMMHALIKSGSTILATCENSCLEFANFVRSRAISITELMNDVQNIISALRDFASRCPPAGPAADMLEMRLSALNASPVH